MNILFYGPLEVRNLGSFKVHIYEVVSNLSKLGHNIIPLSTNASEDVSGIDSKQLVSLWRRIKNTLRSSPIYELLKGEINISWLFLKEIHIFFLAFVLVIRKRERVDVIYRRHSLFNSEYFLARLFRIPSVREVNGIIADEAKITKGGDNFSLQIIDRVERFSIRKADKIIVVTPKLKEVLHNNYKVPRDKIVVIPNGVNTNLFRPIDQKEIKKDLGFDQDTNYICFVGSLIPWQGVEFLIRSAPLILKEHPKTKFLIVGDGPLKEELIELAEKTGVSDKFIFTGAVPYEEVPKYINASDVCVVYKKPLRSGYSPLKLYEYMACGKPVVASRVEGFEILEQNKAGILVEPENPEELAKAIIKLLKDEGLRRELGENGRKYVAKNHSWESVARKVAEVCKSVVVEHENKRR